MRTVVLIGPPAAGKSTVGPILAAAFGTSFVDADEAGGEHYRAFGQPLESFMDKIDSEGSQLPIVGGSERVSPPPLG
ncbi:MAG: Shikimate kinase [Ilumatobacteraceae bacterium]